MSLEELIPFGRSLPPLFPLTTHNTSVCLHLKMGKIRVMFFCPLIQESKSTRLKALFPSLGRLTQVLRSCTTNTDLQRAGCGPFGQFFLLLLSIKRRVDANLSLTAARNKLLLSLSLSLSPAATIPTLPLLSCLTHFSMTIAEKGEKN